MEVTGPLLAAERFSFSYGEQPLLQELTFAIPAGTRCAIIGPNGAGKSTLLKCFLRLLPRGAGRLAVAGRELGSFRQRELARWLAYVPQAAGRQDLFTVRDFVLLGRYPRLSPFSTVKPEDWRVVSEVLGLTGLEEFSGRIVATLSGGEQQKALIAAALAQGAQALLLDEPAAHLDPKQQHQVYALLERLHRQTGVTLVEVTHDVNRAALGHDQVLALRAGRLVYDGPANRLMEAETLRSIYGKSFLLAPHPVLGRTVAWPEVAA